MQKDYKDVRFWQKVWKIFHNDEYIIQSNCANKDKGIASQDHKKVTEDLNELKFNTSISQLMIFINHLQNQKKLDRDILHTFLILLNPFAPHFSEELNEKLGHEPITSTSCKKYDEKLIIDEMITIAVQFNGKTRGTIQILKELEEDKVIKFVKNTSFGRKYLSDLNVHKTVYIPNRIINFIGNLNSNTYGTHKIFIFGNIIIKPRL